MTAFSPPWQIMVFCFSFSWVSKSCPSDRVCCVFSFDAENGTLKKHFATHPASNGNTGKAAFEGLCSHVAWTPCMMGIWVQVLFCFLVNIRTKTRSMFHIHSVAFVLTGRLLISLKQTAYLPHPGKKLHIGKKGESAGIRQRWWGDGSPFRS